MLAAYLQARFAEVCGPEWQCRAEAALLPPALAAQLGYAPRADVLLERRDGSERLWIEFEVSRADPAANHAKFATAHLFQPQPASDAFVAMVSPHVARGRRNLAANLIALMRRVGMRAFQTVLLPHAAPGEVKRLNHLPLEALREEPLDAAAELERAMTIVRPVCAAAGWQVYWSGDLSESMRSLHACSQQERSWWGGRILTNARWRS